MKSPQMSSKSGGKSLCTVCGDESSGFHYGVDSCEGCKGFFRRCITQGMSHKCANEEKCEITPFTRNSCQYCRLKKCFEVGMSREASRLGRRPKRLKEVGGESSGGSRTGNLPIAPYPAPQDMNRLRMEELQKILHSSGSLKDDLLQAFVSVAKASFQEHSKTGEKPKGPDGHYEHKTMGVAPGSQNQGLVSTQGGGGSGDGGGGGGGMSAGSSAVEARSASVDSVGQGAGGSSFDVDSPSSLHSPGGSCMADLSLVALDSFLFEQSQPGTPAGGQPMLVDGVGDLQSLGSPYSHHPPGSVGLDSLSTTASPLSELNTESLLPSPSPSSLAVNGRGVAVGNEAKGMKTTSHNATPPALPACLSACSQLQHQQYLPPRPFFMSQSSTSSSSGGGDADIKLEIKMEPGASFSPCHVKTEPVSPETSPSDLPPLLFLSSKTLDYPSYLPAINVKAIVEEVQQTPTETRRLLIEQVTNAVVDAHLNTTLNTREAIDRAKKDIKLDLQDATRDPEKLKAAAGYMWQQFVSAMAPEITNVVRFCRKLPGFVEIEQEDQIRLIKQGSFEVMMTRFALLVDSDTQTLLDPTLTVKCPRYVIQATPMGEFLDEFFCVAAKFKPLKLTDGEVGLFTSVLIVCPSRKGLKNESAIGKIQSLFQQALYILIKHNHPDAEDRFSRLMELVAMFRRVNEEHYKAISDIRLQTENNQFPELHKEVFDNSHHF